MVNIPPIKMVMTGGWFIIALLTLYIYITLQIKNMYLDILWMGQQNPAPVDRW
jgi:hypothetical protein